MFFKPAIDLLQRDGHDVLGTSRDYREANELSHLKDLKLLMVGSHGGSNLYDKLFQSSRRIVELTKTISKFSPDVVISFSSPEASRVAFGLGKHHLGFNDSPHAEAVAKLTIPLLSKLFSPKAIPLSAWKRYGISPSNIIRYDGLDPIAWLRLNHNVETIKPNNAMKRLCHEKDSQLLETLGIDITKKSILVRLEESKAAYISNKSLRIQPLDFVDHVVDYFGPENNVIILCRYTDQIKEMSKRFSDKAIVLKQVVDGVRLLRNIDVFVGAGGTMTAESALLGRPTISIAPIQFYIDDYLKKIGLVRQVSTPNQLKETVSVLLSDDKKRFETMANAIKIINSMENPIDKLMVHLNSMNRK